MNAPAGGEGRGHGVDVLRLQHVLFGQLLQPDEIGPLQVLDQRMVGRKTARRRFQAVAVQLNPARNLRSLRARFQRSG